LLKQKEDFIPAYGGRCQDLWERGERRLNSEYVIMIADKQPRNGLGKEVRGWNTAMRRHHVEGEFLLH
jgi:hypothetical protein